MKSCNCADILWLENGSGLYFMQTQHTHVASVASPPPEARSFELPGDRVLYAPDRPADVRHVKLDITLDFEQETVSGTVYTTFSALFDEVKTVTFDAIDLHIERVTIEGGGELLCRDSFSPSAKKLVVTLDRPYHYGEQFTIAIEYHAKPRTGMHFVKPASEDPTRPVQVWTVGQPSYHRYWFPCHDAPNDRATTEMIVTVPAQFLTVSNGNLLSVTDNGATKTHHWRHDVPHATYLVSLVVGEFAVIEDSYNGKPVTYYVRPDRKDDAPYLFSKTPEMMRFFSEYTGVEYPYDKYAQTVVEIYANAMEHTTATTHSFSLLMDKKASLDVNYVRVVAHELAHQWFGDLVTCRDWSNGWLNEGFASYFTELWTEHDRGKDEFKQEMLSEKQIYLQEDSSHRRPIVYYVFHEDGEELFDRHMYQKGCWVLHMLRHQLGEAAFRRGIQTYLERYRTREVITADLERTLEEVTGRSLAQFFQQWVYQGGYPAFEVSYSWDSEHTMAKVKIRQTQKVDALTPCFVTPVDLAFTIPTSDKAAKDEHTTETRTIPLRVTVGEDGQIEQSFYLPLEREPIMVRFDPDGWLLKTLTFNRSGKMLRYQLAHDPDTLGRIEAATELGEEGDDESVAALKHCLFNASFWGVRAAAATALGAIGTEAAQTILLQALTELDATHYSQVRAAVATALGQFAAPQQAELAQRSAQALGALLETGDAASYMVESAAAAALGKTRAESSVAQLLTVINRPSWNHMVQRGIFAGLAASGEDRVVDTIATYLTDTSQHPTMRLAAALGMWALGRNRYLYSEEAKQRAVTALCHAVEHDSWDPVRIFTPVALLFFGEKRAIDVLERASVHELNTRALRSISVAAHVLRTGDTSDEQLRQLRTDLDLVREENRKFKEQLGAIEARLG